MKSIGTQIAIDMYNCSDLLLSDASGVQATIQSAAADFAMQPPGNLYQLRRRHQRIFCFFTLQARSCDPASISGILALSLLMFSPVSKMPTQTD